MAWFGWRAIRGYRDRQAGPQAAAHPGQHLLASGAMLYMFLAAPSVTAGGLAAGGTAMAAAGARIPTFALLLAVALFGYVIWTTDRLTSLAPAAVTVTTGGQASVPAVVTVAAGGPGPSPRRGHRGSGRPGLSPGCAGHVAAPRGRLRDRDGRGHGLHADHDALSRGSGSAPRSGDGPTVRSRRSRPTGGWFRAADRAGSGLRGWPTPRHAAVRAWPGPTGWPGPRRPSRPG